MPLNKSGITPVSSAVQPAVQTAVQTAVPTTDTATAVAEAPKKRSLKAKAIDAPTPGAVEAAINQAADTAVKSLQPKTLDDKSKQIQKQGLWQAVVQSNALVQYAPTLDAFLDLVDKAADRGLQYVNSNR